MPYIENWPEFCERQDCEYLPVSGQVIFANGATASMDTSMRRDPPTDPAQLTLLRQKFLGEKLRREIQDYHAFKEQCLNAIRFARSNWNAPPPPREAKAQLEAGKARIELLQAELASLEVDYLATPEGQAEVARQSFQLERQRELSAMEQDIMSVNCEVVNVTQDEQSYQRLLAVQQAAQQQSLAFYSQLLGRR